VFGLLIGLEKRSIVAAIRANAKVNCVSTSNSNKQVRTFDSIYLKDDPNDYVEHDNLASVPEY
jgi:hypothetical protein